MNDFQKKGKLSFVIPENLSHCCYPLPVTTSGVQSGNCPSRQRKWEIFGYRPRREVLHKYFLLLQWWMRIKCVLPRVLRKPANFAVLCADRHCIALSYYCTVVPRLNLALLQMPLVPQLMQNSDIISDMF